MSKMPQCDCGQYVMHGDCLCDTCAQKLKNRISAIETELAAAQKEVKELKMVLEQTRASQREWAEFHEGIGGI